MANRIAYDSKGTMLGQLTPSGELVAMHWGRAFPTGIKPQVISNGHAVFKNVHSSQRVKKVVLACDRHFKAGKDGESFIVTIFGEKALVETNKVNPRIVSVPEARKLWAQS